MGKKYFLQDEEIRNVGEDYFRHDDLAANIRHILKENSAPYNIAVIGKWGLGKSSLRFAASGGRWCAVQRSRCSYGTVGRR